MFASCGKDKDNFGSVTFGSDNWDIQAVNGKCYTNYGEIQAGFFSDSTARYPYVYLDASTPVGAYTGTFDTASYGYGSNDLFTLYYCSAKDQMLTVIYPDSTSEEAGDYWAKNISYTVDSFDATGATISFTLSADMFDFYKAYTSGMNVANAATTAMTMSVKSATVAVDNSAKAINAGKLARPSQVKGARITK